jgi:hypothetical protein
MSAVMAVPESEALSPTKAAESLVASASPVLTSTPSVLLDATIDGSAGCVATRPITCPPTPSPLTAASVWVSE